MNDKLPKFISEEVQCSVCATTFFTESSNRNKKYCSISCANKDNKTKHGQFALVKICPNCNKTHSRVNSFYCDIKCRLEAFAKSKTIEDMIRRKSSNRYDSIRSCARNYSKYIHPAKCMHCGYDKHYEVCHIKPIHTFKISQMLSEVNHQDNLIHLCPNCHWELDHDLVTIEKDI